MYRPISRILAAGVVVAAALSTAPAGAMQPGEGRGAERAEPDGRAVLAGGPRHGHGYGYGYRGRHGYGGPVVVVPRGPRYGYGPRHRRFDRRAHRRAHRRAYRHYGPPAVFFGFGLPGATVVVRP